MVEENSKGSISNKDYLYRIVRFDYVVEILKGELYFSHPSKWDDPYETHIKHDYDKSIFAQCWSKASMSDAMWRIYSPGMLGVRLRTNRFALDKAMRDYVKKNKKFKMRLKDVEYMSPVKYREEVGKINDLIKDEDFSSPSFAADLLCLKRSAFNHEREVRAIIYDSNVSGVNAVGGIKIAVDGHALIDSVLFDPRAPEELCNAMMHYLKNVLLFKGRVGRSKLYTVIKPD